MVARGDDVDPPPHQEVALSDGAGEVVEIGAEVTRLRVGDRAMTTCFPDWADRPSAADALHHISGALLDGVLCGRFVAPWDGLVRASAGVDCRKVVIEIA